MNKNGANGADGWGEFRTLATKVVDDRVALLIVKMKDVKGDGEYDDAMIVAYFVNKEAAALMGEVLAELTGPGRRNVFLGRKDGD